MTHFGRGLEDLFGKDELLRGGTLIEEPMCEGFLGGDALRGIIYQAALHEVALCLCRIGLHHTRPVGGLVLCVGELLAVGEFRIAGPNGVVGSSHLREDNIDFVDFRLTREERLQRDQF